MRRGERTSPTTHREPVGSARGFTLVEALATLVLVAIVLPVTLRGITLALSMGSTSARRTEAIMLAESKLSELLATGAWEGSALEGDFTTSPSGESLTTEKGGRITTYRWAATVEDWLDTTVKELTVRIIWEARGVEQDVALTTLVNVEEE
jgi:prepilin-type N-terminal cleavage/methylation domain-containing protein